MSSSLSVSQDYLLLNLDKRSRIDGSIVGQLRSTGFTGCVPFEVGKSGRAVRYNLDGLISVRMRFKDAMTVEEFYYLIYQVYHSLLFLFNGNHRVSPQLIDYTADLVFLDGEGNVRFLVYPLELKTVEGRGSYALLSSMIKGVKPFENRDEEGIRPLRSLVQSVESGKVHKAVFLKRLYAIVSDFYDANLLNYKPDSLPFLVSGLPYNPSGVGVGSADSEVESVEEVRQVNGIKLHLEGVDADILEHTQLRMGVMDGGDNDVIVNAKEVRSVDVIAFLKRGTGEIYTFDSRDEYYVWYFGSNPKSNGLRGEVAITLGGNTYISRVHFKIELEESTNHFYLTDMHSYNGTYVDGIRCEGTNSVRLVDGSVLKVANEEFSFSIREV